LWIKLALEKTPNPGVLFVSGVDQVPKDPGEPKESGAPINKPFQMSIRGLDDFGLHRVFYWQSELVRTMTYSILVVDDNDMNLDLIAKILELEGYQVTKARNGVEAIQSVMQSMPDLAVLDVMMPDMDGYQLCQKLRQPPINAVVPIVLLTAMSSEIEREMALKAGANEIWSKPFDMELFRRSVGDLLKRT
jgi:CheY-like chemotaxis protein